MKFPPTTEQQAIIDTVRSTTTNIMIIAGAGCAKTTSMVMAANAMPVQPALALAFNVSIKKELEKQFPDYFAVKTLNGLGHSAWIKAIGRKVELDDRKIGKLVTRLGKEAGYEMDETTWAEVLQLVNAARNGGLVPSTHPFKGLIQDTQQAWESLRDDEMLSLAEGGVDLARAVLVESVKMAFSGVIDFTDQIYMSALFGGVFPRFPVVMVDEAQDLSPLNHLQIRKSAAGRLIVVGDPKQAIYAFRGADSESMAKLKDLREDWAVLPLMKTFRCPKKVVARQLDHVPNFEAAPGNAVGHVEVWREPWELSQFMGHVMPGTTVAILCRNNAPLLSIAFKLIRAGIGCVMLGRDIGKGLKALAKKICPDYDQDAESCRAAVNEWIDSETQLAMVNDKEHKIAAITDRGQCLLAVLDSEGVQTMRDLLAKLEMLFSRETGQIHLATGHKAKGLEWDTVFHLDPWRIPSKWAKTQAAEGNISPMTQELNLRYVIETRTRHTLITANLEQLILPEVE